MRQRAITICGILLALGGATFFGAALGLTAEPARSNTLEPTPLFFEATRLMSGWVSFFFGCCVLTRARRLVRSL